MRTNINCLNSFSRSTLNMKINLSNYRLFSTSKNYLNAQKTGVVFLNMGGPSTPEAVKDYLTRLFSDEDLIPLGGGTFQRILGEFIARRRTPTIEEHYKEIGGGSPILKWSESQLSGVCKNLDKLCTETAPHKGYVAFRYTSPLTEVTVEKMKADGITRALAFTQYPQFSYSTTASSLNELAKVCSKLDPEGSIKWRLIDRWPSHPGFINSVSNHIRNKLKEYPPEIRDNTIILFSAHSLPMSVVNKGDSYPAEVAASVYSVMTNLEFSNPYILCWQSKVGPSPWLGPQTDLTVKSLVESNKKNIIIVPIAFTSDHIETLHELDIELIKELNVPGVSRAESLNDDPEFIDALSDIAAKYLKSGISGTKQLQIVRPIKEPKNFIKTMEFFESRRW